jgi:ankyrin repeat protein
MAAGHSVAEVFSHLLQDSEEANMHRNRDSYATQVLRLIRSDPALSAGMPLLVKAFFEGDESTARSLFDSDVCVCSSTVDGCSPLHWLFAFQGQPALDDIIQMLREKTKEHCLATMVNSPFSYPRDVHCQWPLRLLGSPLAVAISVNSLSTVKALLELGADPFSPAYCEVPGQPEDHRQKWTAFHVAARYHCVDILQYLIDHFYSGTDKPLSLLGPALSFSTSLERLAMHGSRHKEQLDQSVRIIQSIQSLEAAASNGMTAMMQAIDFQDYDVVASLLQAAPELATTPFCSPRDRTIYNLPIHFAAQIASHRQASDTLEIPGLINSYTHQLDDFVDPPRDSEWRTPLHLGATGSSSLVLQWILQKNPNLLHVEDGWRRTPLQYCTSSTTCKTLLQRGARINQQDKSGITALHRACLDRASELAAALLAATPDLSLANNKYGTALHCAVIGGSVDVVRLVLEAGAPINMADYMGNTALHVAAKLGRHHILRMLLHYGADATLKNVRGRDARSIASDEDTPASQGLLHLLSRHLNVSKPFSGRRNTGAATKTSKWGSDFLWTTEELELMARTAERRPTGQVHDTPQPQGVDDLHQSGNSDDEFTPGELGDKARREAVMSVVHQTVQRCETLQPSSPHPMSKKFLDSLVGSSLALAEADIWQTDLASRAVTIMERTVLDLAIACIDGLDNPSPTRLATPVARRGLTDEANRNDGASENDGDGDGEDGGKGVVNGNPESGRRDSSISGDDTDSRSIARTQSSLPSRPLESSYSDTDVVDVMISHVAQLVFTIKPPRIFPGRSAQSIAQTILCKIQRLSSTSSMAGAEGDREQVPTFYRPPHYLHERFQFADQYFQWKRKRTGGDEETGGLTPNTKDESKKPLSSGDNDKTDDDLPVTLPAHDIPKDSQVSQPRKTISSADG